MPEDKDGRIAAFRRTVERMSDVELLRRVDGYDSDMAQANRRISWPVRQLIYEQELAWRTNPENKN